VKIQGAGFFFISNHNFKIYTRAKRDPIFPKQLTVESDPSKLTSEINL